MNREAPDPSDPSRLPPGDGAREVPLPGQRLRRIDSARLFAGSSELLIDHHGVLYRLKQTSLGKLILTK